MVLITKSGAETLKMGSVGPGFKGLPGTDGLIYDLESFKGGKAVVLSFTCNHCPYAQAYEDRLVELQKHFDEEGVQFVLVNSNDTANYPDDSFENMKKRAEEKSYSFPYCHDETQKVAKSYGALCTPHCFVFDHGRVLKYKGRVDDHWQDPSAVTEHNLRDAIAAILKGEEPPAHEVNAIGCSIKWK